MRSSTSLLTTALCFLSKYHRGNILHQERYKQFSASRVPWLCDALLYLSHNSLVDLSMALLKKYPKVTHAGCMSQKLSQRKYGAQRAPKCDVAEISTPGYEKQSRRRLCLWFDDPALVGCAWVIPGWRARWVLGWSRPSYVTCQPLPEPSLQHPAAQRAWGGLGESMYARDSCWHQRKSQGRGETSHAALSARDLEKRWGLNYSRKQSAYTSTDLIFNSRAFNQADERYFQMGWTCPA